MDNHITEIHDHPAVAGETLFFAPHFMLFAHVVMDGICERIDHAVAGACADDEIISKRNDILNVDKDNIFSFFVFYGVDNFTCKF